MAFFSHGSGLDAALIAAAAVAGLSATAALALAPRQPLAPVAVVFAPWTAPDTALATAADAGGEILRAGGAANVVVVRPGDVNYAARVKAAGAVLVADAASFAGCEAE